MATIKKTALVMCLVCLLAVVAMFAAGCQDEKPTEPNTTPTTTVGLTDYTITVHTVGGAILEDVTVYVWESATDHDLVDNPKRLDGAGQYHFTAPTSTEYVVELVDVPAGYDVQEQYAVTGPELEIVLTSAPIAGDVPAGTSYKPGDIIHDYAFTDIDGVQHKISDILKEKNALVLNFWYLNCSFCIKEFPTLQDAYEVHSDKVEVLALNIDEEDSASDIRAEMKRLGLTFPAVKTDASLLNAVKAGNCPATVVIDRYGMICFVYSGDLSEDSAHFRALMRHFGADDYKQSIIPGTLEALDELVEVEDISYGTKKYPYDVGVVEFTGEVHAKEPVYYTIRRSAILRIEDPDVYLTMDGDTYYPENGVLEIQIMVEDMYKGVGFTLQTTGGVDKEVTLVPLPLPGTSENPYTINLGELTIAVNNQENYYSYTAEHTGTFTITVEALPEGISCGVNLMNLRTYSVSEEVTDPETGKTTYSVAVEAGDTVRLIMGAYSEDATDIEVKALASIPEVEGGGTSNDDAYCVTVRDENGVPVAGVTLKVNAAGSELIWTTGEDGVVKMELDSGTYMVTLVLPMGYYGEVQYMMTPANRTLEIELIHERQYTVKVSVNGEIPVEQVTVKIYDGMTLETLICSGVLNQSGEFTFSYGYMGDFVAVLEGLPSNVYVQSYYPLTGELTEIALLQTSIDDTNAANQDYKLGDQMHDFSITTPDGRVYNLNKLLREKKAVMMAFWHTKNAPSVVTFAYLNAAYQTYADELEILAMTPLDKSDTDIADFQGGANDFNFPMAQCSTEWERAMHLTQYPTLVMIDRNGTICLIHSGPVTDPKVLDAVMAHYTAEEYETTVVNSMEQLLPQQGQPDGSRNYPFLVEAGTTQLEVVLKVETGAYYTIQETEPMRIRIENADAYVVYDGQTYTAVDGIVELEINTASEGEPVTIMIGNGGASDVTLTVLLTVLAAG